MRSTAPIVGRDAELGALDAALEAVAAGDSGALAVVGAAGIGKSRLLAELTDRAGVAGHLVLTGAASEMERDLPFGVFVDALDDHLEHLEPHRLTRLEDPVRAELGRVFPALAGSASSAAAPEERYRTHRAVRTLLETLATRPLVLILDDFHWSDSASVELAGTLLRRPPAARVLLVFAFRPRQLPERLTAELGRADRNGTLTRLDLEPLSLAAARELLGDAVPRSAVPTVFAESGGVPLYLEQLARVPTTVLRDDPGAGEAHVPPMVLAALTEELGQLSDSCRLVLQGAAVAGDPFEPELAAAAVEIDEAEALDDLDELLRYDFVRPTAVPRRFRFRHPLVRRAVYEATAAGTRLNAHERCAAALAARGASAEARAHHIERSARQGDVEAAALLRKAGEQAFDRAPGTAVEWLGGALRLLPESAPPDERIAILLPRAQALAAVGRLRDSHETLAECVRLAPHRADLIVCARAQRFIGKHEGAQQQLTAALEAVEPGSRDYVALMLELAIDGFYRVAFDPMHEWAGRAREAAEALGDPALVAAAYSMLTLAGAWTGDVERANAVRPRATALVDTLTDEQLATRLDAGANLAAAELYLDMFPQAGRHAERVMEVGSRTHQTQTFPAMYATRGVALWMEGRLADAADLLDGAVDAARLLNDDIGVAWTLFNRSAVALLSGDLDGALDAAHESVELTAEAEEGLIKATGTVWLGMALLEAGEPARAIEMIEQAGGEELSVIAGGWRVVYHEALCWAHLELGDVESARRVAGIGRAWAGHVGLPLAASMADRADARVALADGDPHTAVELALSSIAHAERAGAKLEMARSRTLAGKALGEAGDHDRAVAELRQAVDALAGYGARRYLEAAEHELRVLGVTVGRRAKARPQGDGLAGLTERELEIARLTVDRLTNRESASRLFLSEKTIETHMRNVFHKLGVSSRVDVARVTERAQRSG